MLDLQLHTTDSDGTWAWDTVLERCQSMGLKAYAITDHDTIVRRDEIAAWARANEQNAIPGIELSTSEAGQTVHLLGYFLEGPVDALNLKLTTLRQARNERNAKIVKKLQQFGFSLNDDELRIVAGSGVVGRPHIAKLLMDKGYVQSIKEAFDRFLAFGACAYVPKEEIPLREGIELLHAAGAVTSVAHSLLLNRPLEALEASIKKWAGWGLDALETYYPAFKPEQMRYLERMTDKYDLLRTGGSDFHGDNKPSVRIGFGHGNLCVPDELFLPLIERKFAILKHS